MNKSAIERLNQLFYFAETPKDDRERILNDECMQEIPDDAFGEIIDAILRNRRNVFITPLAADEFVEAWRGLQIGKQQDIFE